MKRKLLIICLALLVLSLALGSCEGKKAADDVVRIGVYQPLTGANAAGGALELEGVRLAHELNPTVVIAGKTHDEALANKIMRTVQEAFQDQMYITVQFQA